MNALGFAWRSLVRQPAHEEEHAAIRAARDAAGDDARIALDTNCPWSVSEAIAHACQWPCSGSESATGLVTSASSGGADVFF